MGAVKMDENGRNPCTVNSRHKNIPYFFVKYRIDKKEIEIVHCLTEVMLANYSTKTFQVRLFHIFRGVIMVWKHIITLHQMSVPYKERVKYCIDGSKDSKMTYVEELPTGMA